MLSFSVRSISATLKKGGKHTTLLKSADKAVIVKFYIRLNYPRNVLIMLSHLCRYVIKWFTTDYVMSSTKIRSFQPYNLIYIFRIKSSNKCHALR